MDNNLPAKQLKEIVDVIEYAVNFIKNNKCAAGLVVLAIIAGSTLDDMLKNNKEEF